MISKSDAAKELLLRKRARRSLLDFTKYTFPGFEVSHHHKIICDKLDEIKRKVENGDGGRLMIFLPPRHTKSELASRRFPAKCLGDNPNWQIITSTYSSDFAADFGRDVRSIVNSQEYSILYPEIKLSSDVKAANRWNTSKGGVYVATGVGGPLTGRGAHIALIDDPFKDWQSAYSETTRNHIWKWYLTVLRTRLMPGGAIILVMTRWHDDDLAGRLIYQQQNDGDQWDIVSMSSLIETEKDKIDDPLKRDIGQEIWPGWFSAEELNKTKKVMPTYEFSALYQQKPVPDEGDYFKRDWFKWYRKAPEHLNIYLCHDDALTDDGGDFTEIGVFGVSPNDNIYILDWWSGQVTSDVWIDQLLDFVYKYKVLLVLGESGQIRRAVEPFLLKRMQKRSIYSRVEWLASIADKPTRASSFRGLVSMGKVYLPIDKPWSSDLLSQLIRFPAGVYDDKVDVVGLLGRAINSTIIPRVNRPIKKLPIDSKPTLNDILKENSTRKDHDEIRRI